MRVVDVGEGLLEVFVGLDEDDGAEDFFVADLHAGLGCSEDGGRDEGAVALAAGDELGAAFDGFLDPGFDALGFAEADEGADFGGFVGRVAGDQLGGDVDELPEERLEDAALDEDALHADAGLAGVAEGGVGGAESGFVEVGPVAVDDERGVAAEFEQDALAAGVGFELPADFGGAGEADELDAVFFFGEPGGVGVGEGEDGEGLFGPAGLENDFAERERGEGRLRRGLEDDAGSRRRGRARPCGRRDSSGKLKGVMARTGPTGKRWTSPQRLSLPSVRSRGMASPPRRTASSAAVLKVRTARSTSERARRRGLPASATMSWAKRSFCSMSAAAMSSRISRRFQRGQGAGAAQAGDGVVDGLAGVGAGGDGDAADQALVPRRADFKRFAVDPFLAAQQKSCLRSRPHFHGAYAPDVPVDDGTRAGRGGWRCELKSLDRAERSDRSGQVLCGSRAAEITLVAYDA